jgi:hypothetical protein
MAASEAETFRFALLRQSRKNRFIREAAAHPSSRRHVCSSFCIASALLTSPRRMQFSFRYEF